MCCNLTLFSYLTYFGWKIEFLVFNHVFKIEKNYILVESKNILIFYFFKNSKNSLIFTILIHDENVKWPFQGKLTLKRKAICQRVTYFGSIIKKTIKNRLDILISIKGCLFNPYWMKCENISYKISWWEFVISTLYRLRVEITIA